MSFLRRFWVWLVLIVLFGLLMWLGAAHNSDSLPAAPGGCGGG